jgi:hypothetical protein
MEGGGSGDRQNDELCGVIIKIDRAMKQSESGGLAFWRVGQELGLSR